MRFRLQLFGAGAVSLPTALLYLPRRVLEWVIGPLSELKLSVRVHHYYSAQRRVAGFFFGEEAQEVERNR